MDVLMNKRAITPEQKRQIIEQLYSIWLKNPQLRLGQLIWNKFGHMDFFFVEDTDFIQGLEEE